MSPWMAFIYGAIAASTCWMLILLWVQYGIQGGRLAVYPVCDDCGYGPCVCATNRALEKMRAASEEAGRMAAQSVSILEESWRSNERDRERVAIALYLMCKHGFSAADPLLRDIDAGRHVEFAAALPNVATSGTPEGGAA